MRLGARLNKVLAEMMLVQEAGAIDYSRDRVSQGEGGHGAHGIQGGPPAGNSRPLVLQWAERFERMVEAAERDLRAVTHGEEPREYGGTKAASGLRRRIRDYEGRDPVWVAFMEGCSVELVRKARRELGLEMKSGRTLERGERPLTAPPRDTLNAITEEE